VVGAYCRGPEALELTEAVVPLATSETGPEVLDSDKALWALWASTSNEIPDFFGLRVLASSGLEILWSAMLSLLVAASSGLRVLASSVPGLEVDWVIKPSSDTTA
jgi:hypothetical protein